jgi:hypothetical protein
VARAVYWARWDVAKDLARAALEADARWLAENKPKPYVCPVCGEEGTWRQAILAAYREAKAQEAAPQPWEGPAMQREDSSQKYKENKMPTPHELQVEYEQERYENRQAKAQPQSLQPIRPDRVSFDASEVGFTLKQEPPPKEPPKEQQTIFFGQAQPQEPGEFDDLFTTLRIQRQIHADGDEIPIPRQIISEVVRAITTLQARLQRAESLHACDLHGMQDGSLLRDYRAENDRLLDALSKARAKALEEAVQAVLDAGGDNAAYHAAAIRALIQTGREEG